MIIYVPLTQIEDNPFQARTEYGEIAELAADIARHYPTRPDSYGLQQIPSGRLVGDDGLLVPFAGLDPEEWLGGEAGRPVLRPGWIVQLEYGHRRFRAFQHLFQNAHAKWGVMPVNILDLDDTAMLDGVWSENSARRNLSAVEEAELLQKKLATVASQREVAEAWGLARSTIANRLSLLALPEEIQQANRDGRLSERQALSLAPVLELQEKANGAFKKGWWSDEPANYIKAILAKPDKHTSDDIREYAKRATRHAGTDIPAGVLKLDCTAAPDKLVQAEGCKGCPQRIHNYCLQKKCLEAKLTHFGRTHATAAAAQLNYPYSDGWTLKDNDTFTDYLGWSNADNRKALVAIHKNGGCGHLVVGWNIGVTAVRPIGPAGDLVDGWAADGVFSDHPHSGAILGHVGSHADCVKGLDMIVEDNGEVTVPHDLTRAWDKDNDKQKRDINKAVKEIIREALSETVYDRDALDIILALAGWPGFKDDDDRADTELLIHRLVDFLFNHSDLNYSQHAYDHYARAANLLDQIRVPAASLLDQAAGKTRAEALEARARRVLYKWLHSRRWARLEVLQEYTAEIQAIRAIFDEIGPIRDAGALELIEWLENAALDTGTRIAEALSRQSQEAPTQ